MSKVDIEEVKEVLKELSREDLEEFAIRSFLGDEFDEIFKEKNTHLEQENERLRKIIDNIYQELEKIHR